MRRLLNWLSRRRYPYNPLITVGISRGNLIDNYREFQKTIVSRSVAPVLKSNAYGHGLFEIASVMSRVSGVPFFVVDSYFEALAIRTKNIRTPLLIIGYTRPEDMIRSSLSDISFTITSLDMLKSIQNIRNPLRIHIKLDTGMRRQGLVKDEIFIAKHIVLNNKNIILEGICTHFCDADNTDESLTESQISIWNDIVRGFKDEFPNIKYLHASATDGSRYNKDIACNVLRLGIGLYGITENEKITKSLKLKPVLEMSTLITGIKLLKRGETTGYGKTFSADKDMYIATIPVGYFEGVSRNLSNKGYVQIGPNNAYAPIIGRVSMNISTIDVSKLADNYSLKSGLPVTVISKTPGDKNSLASIAKMTGLSTYELIVKIPSHLKRTVIP